ncbi:hypothetical protein [Pleomorphovibrio marinus]|uniref:hypothetical protein n=1 Tax=Pleomorphovibrio marinus TaxID=2164132 RepID=UPI000E0B48E1|nr:hypothetical protein [Pleomorphovibrio marinus]
MCSLFRPKTLKGSNNNNAGRNPGNWDTTPKPRTTEWFNSTALPSWEEYILISLTLFQDEGWWVKNGRLRKVDHCLRLVSTTPFFPLLKQEGERLRMVVFASEEIDFKKTLYRHSGLVIPQNKV